MSRSTPPTPNLSAIEDRRLDRVDRGRSLAEEMREEALLSGAKRRMAMSTGQVVGSIRGIARSTGSNFAAEAARVLRKQANGSDVAGQVVDRDPCARCGTRRDKHDEFGCARWRG